MDELVIDDKTYVSSKRASAISGYAQDYIGQLARAGHVDARRIGGLWYIYMSSLEDYQKESELKKPDAPKFQHAPEPESLVFFDGNDYISASRASKLSGYNQDYIGQLARSGQILARQVGNRWYIERESLLKHKEEKDSLLAAVQSSSVGLAKQEPVPVKEEASKEHELMRYYADTQDLIPTPERVEETAGVQHFENQSEPAVAIPIKLHKDKVLMAPYSHNDRVKKSIKMLPPASTAYLGLLSAAALTVVVVVTFGFGSLKSQSVYSLLPRHSSVMAGSAASVMSVFDGMLNAAEGVLSPPIRFVRR